MVNDQEEFDLSILFNNLCVKEEKKMDQEQLAFIVKTAVQAALDAQRIDFENKLEDVVRRTAPPVAPQVAEYQPAFISHAVRCEETLDVAKCLPEFSGNRDNYISWRQAAHNAYKVYEAYEGSSKHYQAVAIIRNKIRGAADAQLTAFNTVLNFNAIIARLDFEYEDRRPIYLIEQEMGTLRQGNLSVPEYYNEVEKRLMLLANKTTMTYKDPNVVSSLNQKYRADALRIFVSGLRKSLSDILFSARPADLPAALTLAEELESNRERYSFANSYHSNKQVDSKDKQMKGGEVKNNKVFDNKNSNSNSSNRVKNSSDNNAAEPMEVDPSLSALRKQAGMNSVNKGNNSDRRKQRINHLEGTSAEEGQEADYSELAQSAIQSESESDDDDVINFLG